MAENRHPGEFFQEAVLRGLDTIKSVVEGVTSALRVSDGALRQLDDAMTNQNPITPGENPEDTFLSVVATMRAAMEEARQNGSAKAPNVVQRSKEILKKVNAAEPEWRPGPAVVRTAADMFRVALRDMRGSASLINLATGRGDLNDLESLVNWTEEINDRLDKTQKVIAEPKLKKTKKAPKAKAQMTESQIRDTVFKGIAEATDDAELKELAEKVAKGQVPGDQFADEVTQRLESGKINSKMMGKAKKKAILDGVDAGHPLLGF